MQSKAGSVRSKATSKTYISKLESQLAQEREARQKLEKEVEEMKKLNAEISSKLGLSSPGVEQAKWMLRNGNSNKQMKLLIGKKMFNWTVITHAERQLSLSSTAMLICAGCKQEF